METIHQVPGAMLHACLGMLLPQRAIQTKPAQLVGREQATRSSGITTLQPFNPSTLQPFNPLTFDFRPSKIRQRKQVSPTC
jgi:hypothetical protein